MTRHLLSFLMLCIVAATARTQSTLDSGCAAPEHRHFDFWVGSWTVTDSSGTVLGENDVIRIARGCGLREHWRGARGGEGMSLNVWQPALGRWTQFWVGTGVVLALTGGVDSQGRMVLRGQRPTAEGAVTDRITWTPLKSGSVRQEWDESRDGGTSWRRVFSGLYQPREERTPEGSRGDSSLSLLR